MMEIQQAADLVYREADPDANIIMGAVIDESLKDEITVTVIATGFDSVKPEVKIEPKIKQPIKNETVRVQPTEADPAEDDTFDIPTFLRKKR